MRSVVIVGAGAFGASLAWWLARRGDTVTLVDQFAPGDPRATSGGESRLIRCGHGPEAGYTASARRARTLWQELEAEAGEQLLVEVLRNDVVIGTTQGPAVETPEGVGLEVNHGPIGPAQPGDCFVGVTPDILPGDEIRVTADGGTDTSLVRGVSFTGGPAGRANVTLSGLAVDADGVTPLGVNQLTVDMRQQTPRIRLTGAVTPQAGAAWQATFAGLTPEEQAAALNPASAYSVTWSNANGTELTIGELGVLGGPGPGCEAAPRQANAVTAFDDAAVNIASGDLVVQGTAMDGTTAVSLALSDSAGATQTYDATPSLSANVGQKTWSVTVPRSDLATLRDGQLTAAGTYTVLGAPLGGATKSVLKDVVAPVLAADPASGTYEGARGVALSSDGSETVRYNTDGTAPNANSRAYSGTRIALGTGQHVITAAATDAAGNRTDATFNYTITAPVAASAAKSKPSLTRLGTAKRIKRSKVLRSGIRLSMRVGDDAEVVRIRVFRKLRNGRRLMYTSRFRSPSKAGLYRTSLNDLRLRKRMRVGSYEVEGTPGLSRTDLGKTSKYRFQVVKG
jgi:hypothetical protein